MDLENEFRQAMAEHVGEMSAPRTLAHDARRRHHRTVRRRTAMGVTAAGVVVAVAVMPAYHAFRPETVGAPGGVSQTGQTSTGQTRPSAPASGPTSTSSAGPVLPKRPDTPSRHPAGGPDAGSEVAKVLLRYLPPGIGPKKTCRTTKTGARETTTCRWTGSSGWIEVELIGDRGLVGLSDLGFAAPVPTHVSVRGRPALRADAPLPQVTWIERGGLAVLVKVSPGLGGRLARVADGVRVS